MAFDPDRYLQTQTTEGFDPDSYLGIKPPLNVPTPQGPFVGSDRPARPSVQQSATRLLDYVSPLVEVPLTVASSFPAAVAYGHVPSGSAPEQYRAAEERAARFQYRPQSPISQQIIETGANLVNESKISPFVPMAGQLARTVKPTVNAVAADMLPSYAAMVQEVSPAAKAIAQNPLVQRGTEVVKKGIEKVMPQPERYTPSETSLYNMADSAFQKAKREGVEIDTNKFVTDMGTLTSDLRSLGFDERLHPKVAVAIENLTNPSIPKDLSELKTIREFIMQAQKSSDSTEKMLGTTLKNKFDEYLATLPKDALTGGSKEGLKAWRDGQIAYSRLSKSQTFTEMLEKAELDAQTIGVEKSLSNQLTALAKNDRKMRLFTKAERDMITEAAKGGNVQNVLRYMARFSPNSPMALTLSGAVGAGGGALMSSEPLAASFGAVVAPAIGGAARLGATKMRKTQVERLAEAMRNDPNAAPEVNWQKPMTMNDRVAEVLRRFNQGEQ